MFWLVGLSLGGIPPLRGFIPKFLIIETQVYWWVTNKFCEYSSLTVTVVDPETGNSRLYFGLYRIWIRRYWLLLIIPLCLCTVLCTSYLLFELFDKYSVNGATSSDSDKQLFSCSRIYLTCAQSSLFLFLCNEWNEMKVQRFKCIRKPT